LGDEPIYLSELLLLVVWLGGPAFAVGLGAQVFVLWRNGLGRQGRRTEIAAPVLASGVFTYVLTLPLWILVPPRLMAWPGSFGHWPFMFLGVFFVPTVLALMIVWPCTTWLALRDRRRATPRQSQWRL
jgi:hypothetical protein